MKRLKKMKLETLVVTVAEQVTTFEIELDADLTDEEKRELIFEDAKNFPSDGPLILDCSNSDLMD